MPVASALKKVYTSGQDTVPIPMASFRSHESLFPSLMYLCYFSSSLSYLFDLLLLLLILLLLILLLLVKYASAKSSGSSLTLQ